MIDFVRRHIVLTGALLAVLLVLLFNAVAIVPETRQAIVVRFGKPVGIVNAYVPGHQFGQKGAGIAVRIPFAEQLVWIDKRIRDVDMERQQVLSTDQRRLEVDAFARYRIVNPVRMYITARSEEQLEEALKPILGSQLRNELGKRPFASLLTPEREGVMENIRTGLNRVARHYGVDVIDVRIKKADLPGGTLASAFQSMITARQQEARSIRAQGLKQAQIITGQADADAAQTYAAAFGKDPQFYDFYRAMQSYRSTFLGEGTNEKVAGTTVILSPQNDYLREFTGRSR